MKLLIFLLVLGLVILNFSVRTDSSVRQTDLRLTPPLKNESSLVPLSLQHRLSPATVSERPLSVLPEKSPKDETIPSNITYTDPHPDNDPEEEEEKRKFQYDDYSNVDGTTIGEGGQYEKSEY